MAKFRVRVCQVSGEAEVEVEGRNESEAAAAALERAKQGLRVRFRPVEKSFVALSPRRVEG